MKQTNKTQEVLKDLQLKKTLYANSNFLLFPDSFKNEVINLEFSAIDQGLYHILKQRIKNTRCSYEDQQIKQLLKGNKLVLGVC